MVLLSPPPMNPAFAEMVFIPPENTPPPAITEDQTPGVMILPNAPPTMFGPLGLGMSRRAGMPFTRISNILLSVVPRNSPAAGELPVRDQPSAEPGGPCAPVAPAGPCGPAG